MSNEASDIIKNIVTTYSELLKLKWYNFFKKRKLNKFLDELYQDLAAQDFNIVSCDLFSILNNIAFNMPNRYPHELDDRITLREHMVILNFEYNDNSCKIEFNMRTLHYKIHLLRYNTDLDMNFEVASNIFVPSQCLAIFEEVKANLFSTLYTDILKSITAALVTKPLELPPPSEQ